MTDDKVPWAQNQLGAARIPVPVGKAVVALLEAWDTLSFPNDGQRDKAIELFGQLARGHALVSEEDTGIWRPVIGAVIQVGDTVRVLPDAYTGELALLHNGRVGRVLAKRSGDIIIRTTDSRPVLDGVHHPPAKLEKLVG